MKVQIEIEIPDGHEVTSLFCGNAYGPYDDKSQAIPYTVHTRPAKPFLINGVPSDWPEWLVCDWVTKDANERVFGHDGDPPTRMLSSSWIVGGNAKCGLVFGTTLTIPGPWEQSLRENPRRKK